MARLPSGVITSSWQKWRNIGKRVTSRQREIEIDREKEEEVECVGGKKPEK